MRIISKLILMVVVLLPLSIFAQTTLSSGDIIIVNINADGNNNFDFVSLVDLTSGTVIKFTDKPWDNDEFVGSEGILTYTSSSTVTAGTIVSYSGTAGGVWASSGSYDLAIAGDNILVYQGTEAVPSFIYGIGFGKSDNWTYTGTNDSDIPTALSKANFTISQLGTDDNYRYKTNTGTNTSKVTWLKLMSDDTYWESNNTSVYSTIGSSLSIGTPEVLFTEIASNSTSDENYIELYNNSDNAFELIYLWKVKERPNNNNTGETNISLNSTNQKNTGGSLYFILEADEYAIILENKNKVSSFKTTHSLGNDVAIFSQSTNPIPTINGYERYQLVDRAGVEIDQLPVWDWDGKDYAHQDSCYVRTSFYEKGGKSPKNHGHDHAPGWLRHHRNSYNYTPAAHNSNSNGGTYPVDLISFNIEETDVVLLKWATASELNTAYFAVERSYGLGEFLEIGTVKASGNSNILQSYNFIDLSRDKGNTAYYRLRIVDFDASVEYSQTLIITSNKTLEFKAYPNPAKSFITIEGIDVVTDNYRIYNTNGQIVKQGYFSSSAIINLDQLSKGVYFIKVLRNKQEYKSVNLIVSP